MDNRKIKRADNRRADTLAGIATSLPIKEAILLPIHVQTSPSVTETSTCNTIEATQANDLEWTDNIAKYLRTGTLPGDPKQAHKIRVQTARFTLIGGAPVQAILHRTLPSMPRAFRDPKDAAAYVKKCDKCQRYAPIPHMPSATLKTVSGPWPFAQWGMDIVGPLPTAPAQKKFLLVATDYFSKWVEAEAYASIKDKDVTKFVWKNIVCRFGIPQAIIADNGQQFDNIAFRNFCSELNIRNSYSTPRYPQRKWVEELPGVLWAYRTTPGRPTGNTPFALAYGMDAVIPTEIGLPTIRIDAAKQNDANTKIGRNLD
ncbi:Pol polyprotein [Vitis vinifera]|uniref:Pol polyprotein n=1 Tax=Vitis vinifera TaxID=29760 RepID=A0A438I0I1_VITVI|nr:Pol polyprotein [Vitis vinifera]